MDDRTLARRVRRSGMFNGWGFTGFSVEEIAFYIGVKRDTVYKWVDRKGMRVHKVGGLQKF